MKLVTAEQMRRIDRETIDGRGIPGDQLMENAGRGIAQGIASVVSDVRVGDSFVVICGKGNNGGDGFVVGRYLHEAGAKVSFYFLGPPDKLSPDAKLNFDRAAESKLGLHEIASLDNLPDELDCDYIVDAVFGTGFSGAPRGVTADLIEYMNRQPQRVIAVDIPSGLNADTGQHEGAVVQAAYTFTLAQPKYGLYISPGRELAGSVVTVPIGIPEDVVSGFDLTVDLITPEMVAVLLPERKPDGHKGDFGKLFSVSGSTGLSGAAAMAAKSALRSGCGLVKIGCPRSVLPLIAPLAMEATSCPLPDVAKKGALALRALGEIRQYIRGHEAVAIGPGLGLHHETKELVRRLVATLERPAVIDADGLTALDGHLELLKQADQPLVLTPHPGEFRRLTGEQVPTDIHQRLETARRFAVDNQVVLVLKGSPTVVADVNGDCYLNPTGNSGMATGGSGDVLTGAVGSLLAQGLSAIDAAVCAVYVHGLAGDYAADELTERSVIAGDLIDFLPHAFETLGC